MTSCCLWYLTSTFCWHETAAKKCAMSYLPNLEIEGIQITSSNTSSSFDCQLSEDHFKRTQWNGWLPYRKLKSSFLCRNRQFFCNFFFLESWWFFSRAFQYFLKTMIRLSYFRVIFLKLPYPSSQQMINFFAIDQVFSDRLFLFFLNFFFAKIDNISHA